MPISARTLALQTELAARKTIKDFQGANGRFERGKHWRKKKPHWDKEWLVEEYITQQKSAAEIAIAVGVTENAIYFWLKKHGVCTRTISEVRAIKHWGMVGEDNPMFGVKGELNHNWRGGVTPERQSFYSTIEWRRASRKVKKRDNLTCQRCKVHVRNLQCQIEIHHIESFSVVEKRAEVDNLVMLCQTCHDFVHSKQNTSRLFLMGENR